MILTFRKLGPHDNKAALLYHSKEEPLALTQSHINKTRLKKKLKLSASDNNRKSKKNCVVLKYRDILFLFFICQSSPHSTADFYQNLPRFVNNDRKEENDSL